MSVENRPYAGNWSGDIKNKYRKVTSWTPDAIVKINGDTALPGCVECKNRIDFQSFITSVNVSGGLDSLSCDISMSIPRHYGDSIFKEGTFILNTGLEIHVYYRGFFTTSSLAPEGDTFTDEVTGDQFDLSEVEMRPYYPVFHGVVTSVSYSYSGGFYSASLSCGSMLHFWETQQINTNAAYMAANPTESRGSVRLDGHVYTNMTPHQIIYDLYRDTGGAAEGADFAWSSRSNIRAKTSGGEDFYSLTMRYWERRFSQGMYDLRMYGASGRLFSSTERAFLTQGNRGTRLDREINRVLRGTLSPSRNAKTSRAFSRAEASGLVSREADRVLRTPDVRFLAQASENDSMGVLATQLKAYILDLGSFGNISLFTTNYESKKQIAQTVAEKVGYEFYQDFDGDLVFKPPLYNLDTSTSRVYRIQREDIIDISYSHQEPTATYVVCKGGAFRNLAGHGMEGEWGVRSTYVDYRLVAKYGWKAHEFDTSFYTNRSQAYYAAVVKLDEINKDTETASVTIPLRPEIKMGYPVYVEHIDTFYYVTSVNHSFSFGGACTTSLQLTARRRKFMPPGLRDESYTANPSKAVNLEYTFLPSKSIFTRDENGNLKSVGFPNVVMALDTTRLDPSFLHFPLDYQRLGTGAERDMFRRMLIMEGYRMSVLRLKNPQEGKGSRPTGYDVSQAEDVFFRGPWILGLPNGDEAELSLETAGGISGEEALQRAQGQLQSGRRRAANLARKGKVTESNEARAAAQASFDRAVGAIQSGDGVSIIDLIEAIKEAARRGGEGMPDGGSSSSIIALLSNKKASFDPNQRGYYRYFSSSHPDPEHQAPYDIRVGDEGEVTLQPPARPDTTDNNMVIGLNGDEVRFVDRAPTRGLNAKTFYTQGFEPTATKDILALTFQKTGTATQQKIYRSVVDSALDFLGFHALVKGNMSRVFRGALGRRNNLTGAQFKAKVMRSRNGASGSRLKGFSLFGVGGTTLTDAETITTANIPQLVNVNAGELLTRALADYPARDSAAILSYANDLKRIFKSDRIARTNKIRRVDTGRTRTVWSRDSFISPVFPISDENGYEVFGAYQYGRGLDIIPRNGFDALLKADPTRIFTNEELDGFLNQLYSRDGGSNPARRAVDRLLNGVEDEQAEVSRISSALGLRASTKAELETQLSNQIMRNDDNQIVSNIPQRLTEINPPTRGDAQCDCRATNDELLMSLIAQGQFVSIEVEAIDSRVVTAYAEEMKSRTLDWKTHQEILKGNKTFPAGGQPFNLVPPYNPPRASANAPISNPFSGISESLSTFEAGVEEAAESQAAANQNMREAFRTRVERGETD